MEWGLRNPEKGWKNIEYNVIMLSAKFARILLEASDSAEIQDQVFRVIIQYMSAFVQQTL